MLCAESWMHTVSLFMFGDLWRCEIQTLKEKTYETFFWFNCREWCIGAQKSITLLYCDKLEKYNLAHQASSFTTMENHWFRVPSHSQRVSKSRKSFSWKRNRWCNTVVVVSDSGYKYCGCKVQNLVMEPIKIFSCVKRLLLSKRRLGLLGINRSELMSAPWTIEMWSEFFIALQSSYSLLYSTQFSQAMCLWLAFQSSKSFK